MIFLIKNPHKVVFIEIRKVFKSLIEIDECKTFNETLNGILSKFWFKKIT